MTSSWFFFLQLKLVVDRGQVNHLPALVRWPILKVNVRRSKHKAMNTCGVPAPDILHIVTRRRWISIEDSYRFTPNEGLASKPLQTQWKKRTLPCWESNPYSPVVHPVPQSLQDLSNEISQPQACRCYLILINTWREFRLNRVTRWLFRLEPPLKTCAQHRLREHDYTARCS